MVTRKGFTLIELLIVVTIIAILAGAAIPYVQDYVDEARRSRCKNDLDEIRNALALYELRRLESYKTDNIASLVGPFLSKPLNDPWGARYWINAASSTVYSIGPDGKGGTGDEIIITYRPRMAVSKIYWYDTNQDGLADIPDSINLYCTRPIATYSGGVLLDSNGLTLTTAPLTGGKHGTITLASGTIASFPLTGEIVPGSDTVTITVANTDELVDESRGNVAAVKGDVLKVLAP